MNALSRCSGRCAGLLLDGAVSHKRELLKCTHPALNQTATDREHYGSEVNCDEQIQLY